MAGGYHGETPQGPSKSDPGWVNPYPGSRPAVPPQTPAPGGGMMTPGITMDGPTPQIRPPGPTPVIADGGGYGPPPPGSRPPPPSGGAISPGRHVSDTGSAAPPMGTPPPARGAGGPMDGRPGSSSYTGFDPGRYAQGYKPPGGFNNVQRRQ